METKTNQTTIIIQTKDAETQDFEAWTDEKVEEWEEIEADRFACGGWHCFDSNIKGGQS